MLIFPLCASLLPHSVLQRYLYAEKQFITSSTQVSSPYPPTIIEPLTWNQFRASILTHYYQLKLYCHVLRSVTGKRNLLIIRLGLHQSFNTLGTPFYCSLPTVITDTSMNSFLGAKSDLTRQPYSSVPARSVGISGTCKRKRAGDDYGSLPTSNSYPAIAKRQKYVYSARENTVKGSRGGCPRDGSISEEGSDEQSNDKKSSNEESSNEESSDEESSSEESSDKGSSGEEGRGSSWICSHVSQGLHAHDLATDKNFSLRTTSSLQIPTLNHPLNAPQSQLMKQCF